MIRKALAWLLTLMMVISILPMSVFATEEATADDSAIIIGDNVTIIENEEEAEEPAAEIQAEETAPQDFTITMHYEMGFTATYTYELGSEGNLAECIADVFDENFDGGLLGAIASIEIDINADITVADPVVIPAGKTAVLNLNGYDIVGTTNAITNNGTLTINDSVGTGNVYTTDVAAQGRAAVVNNGTLTIYGGWYGDSNNDTTDRNAINRGNAIKNYGTVTINGGYFTNVSNQYIDVNAYAYAINTLSGGTTTINNATIYGDINGLIYSDGKTIVNNGSFTLGRPNEENNLWYLAYGDVEIKGGTWNRAYKVPSWNTGDPTFEGSVQVSGGTFNVEVKDAYLAEGYEYDAETGTVVVAAPADVAEVNGVGYATLAEALEAAQAGYEIKLLADVEGNLVLPANVILNGNGKQINGTLYLMGDVTLKGYVKATAFDFENVGTVIDIPVGATLELNGTGRMVIGHGCTFNIEGNITDAKTANVADLTPSLVIPGASFTGAGVTFNVTNAYIKSNAYCSSKNSGANGEFNFNVTNSIWDQTGNLQFSVPTSGKDPTVNFYLTNSELTTTSHLIFGISKGEIVIDNSNVNVGTSRQIENRSTMTIKNGSVVNGAVAISQNAINPGTIIVENATYAVSGQFSGAAEGTGTLIIKKGATVSVGKIVDNANIVIDATGMAVGDEINFTADLSKFAGTIEVINNSGLDAEIVDGKIVLTAAPTPTGTLTNCYTSGTGYWGECGGNAKESFVFKFYNDDTYMGYTSLNNVGGIIDGDVYVSWSIKLDAGSNTDPYWTMAWVVQPKIAMQPNRCEQWVDGVKVAEATVEPNWSDKIFPVVAAVVDNSGEILSYVNGTEGYTLADAINAGGNIVLLRDVTLTEALTVPAGKTVVLDLNGYKVVYNSTTQGEAMITNRGNLTINDTVGSGEIYYNYTGAADPSYGKGNYTISNGGTLTVNGGKIHIAKLSAHAKYPIDNNSTSGDAILVINGGYLYNYNTSAIRQFCNSTTNKNSVTINGGVIEGYCAIWVQNPGKNTVNGSLSITGGEIKTTASAYVNGTAELEDVNSRIYFTIDGEGGAWSTDSAVSITGGTFNENVYLAEGAPATITIGEEATFYGYVAMPAREGLEGSGTEADPYKIGTAEELFLFAEKVNDGTYKNVYVVLTANIDLEQEDWTSIGTSANPFTGTFDGQGYTISNIWSYERGFFGYTSTGNYVDSGMNGRATIKKLTLNGVEVYNQSTSAVGGLVGQAGQNTEISNVTITGYISIYGYGYVGGVVGQGYVHIDDCHVVGVDDEYSDKSTIDANYWAVGGIVGHAGSEGGASITNCSVKNVVIDSAIYGAGSIAGVGTTGPIEDVSAENVTIIATSDPDANGLLVGCNYDKLTGNCTAKDVALVVAGVNVAAPQDMVAAIGNTYYTSLQEALDAAVAGTGNVTVEILADINLTGIDWNPVTVSAPGYPVVTVNGNDKTITGLNDMLFAGTWAGKSGLIINDLTIKDSTIVNDENDSMGTVGVGAFIGFPQASATITLNNCHLVNSTVKGGHWTGGLIGYSAGYAGTDGPVFMNLTITGCSVTGSTITGKGSVGGIIGHGSGNGWTNVVIENTTVFGNTITSTGSSTNKAGAVMGTIGAAGQPTTVNGVTLTGGASVAATVSGNTVKSNGTEITTIYGRQGTGTGMLYVTGGTYDNYPIEKNVSYAAPKEGYVIEENADGTFGLVVDPAYGKVAKIGDNYYTTLEEAFKAATSGCTIEILADVTVDYKWDCRDYATNGSHSQFKEAVTINGNDKTIKFTGAISDGNWNTIFRFEENATVKNLTIDVSEATGAQRVISTKLSITAENVEIIGNGVKYGIIIGESAGAAISNVTATITGCEFTGCGRGVSDNANGQDVKSIAITGSTFTNANVYVSAYETVTFTGNTVTNGYVDIRSYTADNALNVTATGNTLTENTDIKYNYIKAGGTINAQDEFVLAWDGVNINNLADLKAFRDAVNAGDNFAGKTVVLNADIDMAGENWTPIGVPEYTTANYILTDDAKVFVGTFNGNNHVLYNLKIEKYFNGGADADANIGFFSGTGVGAVIKNLTITNVDIDTDGRNVGALVGVTYKGTTLENITVNGNIQIMGGNNVSAVGGMTRYASVTATNIKVSGNYGSTIKGNNIVGGIFAEIAPKDDNCTFSGLTVENVAINGAGGVGGIVGLLTKGTVYNVSVKDVVLTGRTDYQGDAMGRIRLGSVAGLLGNEYATISNATVENVTAKNLDGNAVVLPIIGANYDASSNATEAKIGDTYYATFAGAYAAAKADDTITLLVPVVVAAGETLTLNKAVTITYTSNVPGEDMITNRGTLVIDGATLVYTNTDTTATNVTVSTISCEPGSVLNITGGSVENKTVYSTGSYAFAIDILTNGNLGDVTVTVSGGKIYSDYMAIRQFNNGTACENTLTITGGEIYGAKRAIQVHLKNDAAYLEISGGKVEAGEGGYALCLFPENATHFSVTGGEFIGTVYSGTNGFISGGTFDAEPYAGYAADGYKFVQYADGKYGVTTVAYVAEVNGVQYATLQAAVEAAQNDDVIKFIDNFVIDGATTITTDEFSYETLVYVNGKKITIDFNGYTAEVTPAAPDANGGIEGTLEAVIFIGNGGKLTLKDSTTDAKGGFKVNAGSDLYSLIYNCEASLVIENGNYYVVETVTAGSVIYADAPQITKVYGGTFTLGNASEDGDTTKPWIFNVEGKNEEFIDVKGGTYNQNILMNYGTQKDCEARVPNTKAVKNNGDGTWTIVDAVACIGDTTEYNRGFATLAEAVAAAKAGDKIELLADATVDGTMAIPAGVTIKSNGHTINGSIRMLGDLTLNGPLTITGGLWVGKSGETLTATLSGDKLTASYFMFQLGTYTINADIDAVYGYLSFEGTFEVNSTIHTTGANGEVLYINGNVTLNDGAVLDSDNSVFLCNDAAVLTMKPGSKVDSKLSITKSGAKLVIDATGLTAGEYTGITGTVTNNGNGTIEVINNDALTAEIKNGKIVLVETAKVAKIGDTYYATLAEALTAAADGAIVELLWNDGDAPIAMNGAVTGNKTVTITGTATVDWSKGWLFVGYADGSNAKLIFDNATLTSTEASLKNGSYGIHVSMAKAGGSRGNGEVEFKNSTIDLSYLMGRNTVTVDGGKLTVWYGFAVGARPVSETGEQKTATMTVKNGATVEVKSHNGMGIGYESNGILYIDNATVSVTGLTVKDGSSVVLTAVDATLTAPEGLNVTTTVDGYEVVYENGAYSLAEATYIAQIGDKYYESFTEIVDAVKALSEAGTDVVVKFLTDAEITDYKAFDYGTGNITFTADKPVTITIKTDFDFAEANPIVIKVEENVTLKVYDNINGMYVYYAPSLVIEGSVTGGQNWGCLYLAYGEHTVAESGKVEIARLHLAWTDLTVYGMINNKYVLIEESDLTLDGANVTTGFFTDTNNGGLRYGASNINVINGSVVNADAVTLAHNDTILTVDKDSTFTIGNTLTNSGTINISGKVIVNGTATNNGTIVLTATAATLTAPEGLNVTTTVDGYEVVYANGTYSLVETAKVAEVNGVQYATLQAAINAANGAKITLIADTTEVITIPDGATVIIDLGGKTLNGYIKPCDPAALTVTNGNIVNTNAGASAIEINSGELTLEDVNVTSARHGVRIDGAVTATIDGGTYKVNATSGTRHAVNISGAANVTIKGGTFVGPKGTTMDSGSAVCVQSGATATIEGGNFSGGKNATLGVSGTMSITGGTFDQDPTAYVADGYAALPNLDGNYVVGTKPTATVNNLGAMTIPADQWKDMSFAQGTEDMPLSFVMQFLADQDAADMATSPFADWYGDFVITISGLENDSISTKGIYLAGHYGSFGWIKVPVEDLLTTLDNNARYPVMLGVGMGQKYDYICSGVEDFKCAMYIPEDILEANPNIQVKLELAIVDNSKGSDAATSALVNNENVYSVNEHIYYAEDFVIEEELVVELSAIEASADAEIILKLKFMIPDEFLADESAYVVVTKNGIKGNVSTKYTTADILAMGKDARGRYVFEQGVASGEMTRDVTCQFIDGNGKVVKVSDYVDGSINDSVSRTVADYAKRVLETSTNEKQRNLMIALLTYGGYAQKHFRVDAESPAFDILTDLGITVPSIDGIDANTITQKTTRSDSNIGITQTTQTAFLDSAISFRLFFVLDAGATINDYTFSLKYHDGYSEREMNIEPQYDAANNRYYVDILDVPAALFDYMYTITVTKTATGETYVVTSSILAYAQRVLEVSTNETQRNLAKAMYLYNQAANAFFGK